MLGKRYSTNVSYKIFSGWDFTIQDPSAAILKHSFIRNDLKVKGRTYLTDIQYVMVLLWITTATR